MEQSPHDGLRPLDFRSGSSPPAGSAPHWVLRWSVPGHVVVACSAVSHHRRSGPVVDLPDTAVLPVHEVADAGGAGAARGARRRACELVSGLAATRAVRPGTIVVHTSGANGIGVLAPLTEQGCLPIAVHPAMTFTGSDEDIDRLPDTCFGITAADDVGYAIGQSLVLEIGGEPFRVREDARTLYHAALAHAGNHVVTVVADAVNALRVALSGQELLGQQLVDDAPGGIAERVIGPLTRAAVENTLLRGQAALTGPVARGDAEAVDRPTCGLWRRSTRSSPRRIGPIRCAPRNRPMHRRKFFRHLLIRLTGRVAMTVKLDKKFHPGQLNIYEDAEGRRRCDARAAPHRPSGDVGADDGCTARRPSRVGASRQARAGFGGRGVDLREPVAVQRGRGSRHYPRTMDADLELLRGEGVEVVFAPSVHAMYPHGPRTTVHPGPLGQELEGASRPSHFAGMLTAC